MKIFFAANSFSDKIANFLKEFNLKLCDFMQNLNVHKILFSNDKCKHKKN